MGEIEPLSLKKKKKEETEESEDEYVELDKAALLELMNAVPLGDTSEEWDGTIPPTVLPLSLQEYWDAFWADDAPYYMQAKFNDPEEHINFYTNWDTPSNWYTKEHFGTEIKQ